MRKGVWLVSLVVSAAFAASTRAQSMDLDAECRIQYEVLTRDLDNRPWFKAIGSQAFRPEALVLPADRDPLDILLRRTGALLHHLQSRPKPPDLTSLAVEFESLREEAQRTAVESSQARRTLFEKVWRLQRRMAFKNPLLDFDRLLFVKSYLSQVEHCCDQYFGFKARPGGGVYALANPFSDNPVLQDLLANATVKAGRLQGRRLSGGSFRSPEVSFDGRTVYFAYTECQAVDGRTFTPIPGCPSHEWNPGKSFHVFKLSLDDPCHVEQLTDGPWNDFDPCVLPGGRVVFISERRGGFGRCHGRPVPTYTLHSMQPDGSDIVCLSYHETNEWQPSVTHDGMVIYTRWDYVDRGDCIAHHPWITYPDGRDPRALQGNYPRQRGTRPDTEMDIRAIPGVGCFVATAASHHGQAYGSLVVVDPRIPDDGAMAPVSRLTPEAGFPETADHCREKSFGTAWPLDEDFYLCVYSPPGSGLPYGLYLIDSFGNRTLIYRDSVLPCLGPIPLHSRPMPPVIPHATAEGIPDGQRSGAASAVPVPQEGTVGCINVYESLKPWPTGTVISAIRVVQLFPKTTTVANVPDIGIGSESLARGVLGTVPVEADGSAYFIAPSCRLLYFQALDTNGCAVQSMMSASYVHPGETLTCMGCHENRHQTGRRMDQQPLAFRKPAQRLIPGPEGSYPVSYARLVQPVLNRYCVECHAANPKSPDLSGAPAVWSLRDYLGNKKTTWSRSYLSLIKGGRDGEVKQGFAYTCSSRPPARVPSETTPGMFGARVSKLYQLLQAGHHGVSLPPEALQRLTLWLDCNSVFYGAYHDLDRQRAGEEVIPTTN